MNKKITDLLLDYGLTNKEISIYLYLVGKNKLTAYMIAKETKIHRSTTYDILERLDLKGFVRKIEHDNKLFFAAGNLSAILSKIKDKENILLETLSEIEKLESNEGTKIKLLDDTAGLKQFNFNLFRLASQKKLTYVYFIGNEAGSTLSTNIFIKKLLEEVKKQNLHKDIEYKAIWNSKFKNSDAIKPYLFLKNNRFLDNLPCNTTTALFDNYVAFLYGETKPELIEIKNKDIADEMKFYFEQMWKLAKK